MRQNYRADGRGKQPRSRQWTNESRRIGARIEEIRRRNFRTRRAASEAMKVRLGECKTLNPERIRNIETKGNAIAVELGWLAQVYNCQITDFYTHPYSD